jgi:hypothetical protein
MMKLYNLCVQGWISALITLLGGSYSLAEAQQRPWAEAAPIPSAGVACYFVGRAFLDANGQGQVVGYFTDINGIGAADSLFKGSPSEKTAFFTFRSNVFSLIPLPANGDLGLDLVSAGTFDIYYNSTPNSDWTNPDTFSSGQRVAHFMRPESLFLQVLQTDSAPPPFESISQHTLTETLVSSQSFSFKSHKYDFSALAPGGITLNESFSNSGVQGVTGFPIGLAFAGHCLAVANEGQ